MEAWIFIGLVAFTVLCVSALMFRLRSGNAPLRMPPWIAGVMLVLTIALLGVALLMRSWSTVVSSTLLVVVWSLILIQAMRARRSA